MKSLARIAVIATVSLLAIPSVASARTTLWGGSGFNDLGPAYSLLNVQNGKAALTNVQLIMACTDAEDGTESSRAFDARHPPAWALDQNRFSFNFIARSNGGRGRVRVKASCDQTAPAWLAPGSRPPLRRHPAPSSNGARERLGFSCAAATDR